MSRQRVGLEAGEYLGPVICVKVQVPAVFLANVAATAIGFDRYGDATFSGMLTTVVGFDASDWPQKISADAHYFTRPGSHGFHCSGEY